MGEKIGTKRGRQSRDNKLRDGEMKMGTYGGREPERWSLGREMSKPGAMDTGPVLGSWPLSPPSSVLWENTGQNRARGREQEGRCLGL